MPYTSPGLRQQIAVRARYCCEYCQSAERITSGPMHIEHVVPIAKGGETLLGNLAYACARCNLHKGARIDFFDPVSQTLVLLFNPRLDQWQQHFTWSDDKTRILGFTATGRVTIATLKMNDPVIVMSRSLWVSFGLHPPQDEAPSQLPFSQ